MSLVAPGCTMATITSEQRAYALGVRSNMGYNYAFMSPWIMRQVPEGIYYGSGSINAGEITNPSHTLMFATSIWLRDAAGTPMGGGNWVVETPCWLDGDGRFLAPLNKYDGLTGAGKLFSYDRGWFPDPNHWLVYGGLWPYYNNVDRKAVTAAQNGRVVVGWADTHVTTMPISTAAAGCDAYGTSTMKGTVKDPTKFIWALQQP
jgi:hypothetical protein